LIYLNYHAIIWQVVIVLDFKPDQQPKKATRQYNGLPKKDKRTNNDLQSIAHNTTDGATRTPLKIVVNSGDQDESAV
jgi:hypothetical protein